MSACLTRVLCVSMMCALWSRSVHAEPLDEAPSVSSTTEDAASLAAQAATHFREGRYEDARAAYERALALATDAERAVLEFDVAACLFELGRYDEARALFLASAARDPSLADVARLHAALAALALGDRAFASQALADVPAGDEEVEAVRGALVTALTERERTEDTVAADVDAPPPASTSPSAMTPARLRPRLWVSAEAGWDQNPAQSGGTATSGIAGVSDGSSAPFLGVVALVGATYAPGDRLRFGLGYVGGYTAILDEVFGELSLQDHGGEAELRYTRARTAFIASVRGSCTRVGLAPTYPWYCVAASRLRVERAISRHATVRGFVDAGVQSGRSGYAYLGGPDVAVDADTRVEFARGSVAVGARARYLGLGTLERRLDGMSFAMCGPRCGDETYRIPLAYLELAPRLDAVWSPARRISLRARTTLERRIYSGTSGITNVPESEKRRRDTRLRVRLRAEVVLDAREVSALFLQYELLSSRSNVAFDSTDPRHALDYDDRSFGQHVLSVGVAAAL